MTPEQIHELGLSEVARITKEFEKVRQEVGFKGSLHAVLRPHADQPQVPAEEPRSSSTQGYYSDQKRGRREDPAISSRWCPRRRSMIRPYPTVPREVRGGRSATSSGTPDGSRPGTFYFNAYDLPSRSTWEENDPVPARGRAGAPLPDQPGAGE